VALVPPVLRRHAAAGYECGENADETGFPPMFPGTTLPLPASLASLLAVFGPFVHRPVVPYLLRPGLRVLVSGRKAECVRHAGRGGIVPGLEP